MLHWDHSGRSGWLLWSNCSCVLYSKVYQGMVDGVYFYFLPAKGILSTLILGEVWAIISTGRSLDKLTPSVRLVSLLSLLAQSSRSSCFCCIITLSALHSLSWFQFWQFTPCSCGLPWSGGGGQSVGQTDNSIGISHTGWATRPPPPTIDYGNISFHRTSCLC